MTGDRLIYVRIRGFRRRGSLRTLNVALAIKTGTTRRNVSNWTSDTILINFSFAIEETLDCCRKSGERM